jgi:8-oxo-dGTP pyrophosphatase MutT (NUDIX family)
MSPAPLPPAEYYATLPRHIAGAGAILHDPAGRILLVQPSYRDDTWEIPGGGLDAGEDPRQAVAREVREELGRDCVPGRLLVIDWVPEQPDGRPPLANYLFDGGLITQDEASTKLCPDPGEIAGWRLAAPAEWDTLLAGHLARRVHACSRALTEGRTLYLHHGFDPARHQA